MLNATTQAPATDPTGRCFLCYRSSSLDQIKLLNAALSEVGVPTWLDRQDLRSAPTEATISAQLKSPETAAAVVWITKDFQESQFITRVELPHIIRRVRRNDGFHAELMRANDLTIAEAAAAAKPSDHCIYLDQEWNFGFHPGALLTRLDAQGIAQRMAEQRLRTVGSSAAIPEIRIRVASFGGAAVDFQPGFALHLGWADHFESRFAKASTWSDTLLPAVLRVQQAVAGCGRGKPVAFEGVTTLAMAFALGRGFRETTGLRAGWRLANELWNIDQRGGDDGGLIAQSHPADFTSSDLAVFVSVSADVEPAVSRTPSLPRFRARVNLAPADGSPRLQINSPRQAAAAANQIVQAIQGARAAHHEARKIHLFYAGPAALAFLLGQLSNSLGPVQTYELAEGPDGSYYEPAALLKDAPPPPRE